MTWNLSEAKNRLNDVLTEADTEAQTIVRQDRDYVLMSGEEYRRLKGKDPSFTDFLIDSGPRLDDLDLPDRKAGGMRDPQL